jgi:homoserine kinase
VVCVVVRPAFALSTAKARAVLRPEVPLGLAVRQAACFGAFVAACHDGDIELLSASMRDLIVGPQRAPLVPGFDAACRAATAAGALGCSLAGAGPTVMAWTRAPDADAVRAAITAAFAHVDLDSEAWVSPIDAQGAQLR